MPIAFDARLVANESVLINTFDDGESVLLNLDTEHYFGLNQSGSLMWKRLTSEPTIEAAYAALLDDFVDARPEELRQDLAELVDHLVEHALVSLEPAADDA